MVSFPSIIQLLKMTPLCFRRYFVSNMHCPLKFQTSPNTDNQKFSIESNDRGENCPKF